MITMIVTLSISFVLLFVLLMLFLPRKKVSPAAHAEDAMLVAEAIAVKLVESPSKDGLKKLLKAVRRADNALSTAVYKGLVELNPAVALNDENLKIIISLIASKANAESISDFVEILLENVRHSLVIVQPFAKREVDDSVFAIKTKHGATVYLNSVKAKKGGGDSDEEYK